MEKREEALKEALQKNEEEKQRWEKYLKEQETAIENLERFSKKLSVDIMVPIGRRAFMPGRLIHTNEVMVAHFQDYFSNCSAHTATEIVKTRIERAKQHLEKLETERELFENKLEKPYLDGVLPTTEEREIIEEYDEEKEKIWREAHKEKVKKAKLQEKQEREKVEARIGPDEDIFQKLEEQDMMDELNAELDELDIETHRNTEDLVSKLMSGELNLPSSKKRIAHNQTAKHEPSVTEIQKPVAAEAIDSKTNKNLSSISKQTKSDEKQISSVNSDDDSDLDTQAEVRLIQEQAEYLPEDERAGFFEYEMRIIDGKLAALHLNDEESIKEKMRLLNIRYSLEELIELHEEAPEIESDTMEVGKDDCEEVKPEKQQKRRISFALEDQTLEFRKNETVAQMLPTKTPTEEKPQRDVIRLDEPILGSSTNSSTETCKRKTIAEKVEENLKTQSSSDGDLVNQILGSSITQTSNTLRISFKHSRQQPPLESRAKEDVPQSPADLYELYRDPQSVSVEEVDSKEKAREKAFVDVRSEFMSPLSSENIPPEMLSKSILKNKSAVDREQHIEDNKTKTDKQKKGKRKPKDDSDYLSAYNKVMGEVLENNPVQQPDPLPKEKFIDMHTPKKRISRFKQMRQENQ